MRDEARALPGLFAALARQRSCVSFSLVMLFDGCRDRSLDVAERSADEHRLAFRYRSIERDPIPHAGRARAAAFRLGCELVGQGGLVLGTDADTRPAVDWVAASAAALERADLVCGRIERRRIAIDAWRIPIEAYLDRLHQVRRGIDPVAGDAVPSHWHQGGASLGMTAAAWDRIGSDELPASGEDRALVHAARLAGLVVRQDPSIRVRTSSRGIGRAVGGLSDALRSGRSAISADGPRMEHPVDVVERFRRSAIARTAYPCADPVPLSSRLRVPYEVLRKAAAHATSADAFVTALPLGPSGRRSVPLGEASRMLAEHEPAS